MRIHPLHYRQLLALLATPANAAPPADIAGTYLVEDSGQIAVVEKDGRAQWGKGTGVTFVDDKRANVRIELGKMAFDQPYRWHREGTALVLKPAEKEEEDGPPAKRPRATRLLPVSASPIGTMPAGTWMATWIKMKFDDEPQIPTRGKMRVTLTEAGKLAFGNGTEIGTLNKDTMNLRAAERDWKIQLWRTADNSQVLLCDENSEHFGILLAKEAPSAAAPPTDGAPADWAKQPQGKWPLIVLRHEAEFSGGFKPLPGAAFLYKLADGPVNGMTARGPLSELPGFLDKPKAEEEVRRGRKFRQIFRVAEDLEFNYDVLNEKRRTWTLTAPGGRAALEVTGTSRRPVFLLDAELEHLPLTLTPQEKWPATVLSKRSSQFGWREKVHIAIPAAGGQRVVSGHVYHLAAPDPFNWAGVQLDEPVSVAACTGAPALDTLGRATGVVIGSESVDEEASQTSFVTVQRIIDIPAKATSKGE